MTKTFTSREDTDELLRARIRKLVSAQHDRDRVLVKAMVLLRDQLQVLNGDEFELCKDEISDACNDFINFIKTA